MHDLRLLKQLTQGLWIRLNHGMPAAPAREFVMPKDYQFDKIYFILSSMRFEEIEQKSSSCNFEIDAFRQSSGDDVRKHLLTFSSFSVHIDGMLDQRKGWKVRITLQTDDRDLLSPSEHYSAGLILEDLVAALRWQSGSILSLAI
jgi:hypothetical protein